MYDEVKIMMVSNQKKLCWLQAKSIVKSKDEVL